MMLAVNVKQTGDGVTIIAPKGTLNSETSGTLDMQVRIELQKPIKTLVMDMTGVDFISSDGVGVIIKAKDTASKNNTDFAMINLQPQVKTVFEIIRLLPTLNVFESVEELDVYLDKLQHRIAEGDDPVSYKY